jgi:spore coat protein CotH
LLDNSSQDVSFLRWKLASELFLKAGLPATRVNFSRVRLNDRDLGLYLLVEPTDKVFLTRHFGSSAGNLYEGSNTDVEDKLDLDSGDPATAQRDLQSLASGCREPNLPRRWNRLQELLDVNRFAAFMAEVLICHHDGYALDRNNFRIYHDRQQIGWCSFRTGWI